MSEDYVVDNAYYGDEYYSKLFPVNGDKYYARLFVQNVANKDLCGAKSTLSAYRGIDVNAHNVLALAILNCDVSMVSWLVENGANITRVAIVNSNQTWWTACIAAKAGAWDLAVGLANYYYLNDGPTPTVLRSQAECGEYCVRENYTCTGLVKQDKYTMLECVQSKCELPNCDREVLLDALLGKQRPVQGRTITQEKEMLSKNLTSCHEEMLTLKLKLNVAENQLKKLQLQHQEHEWKTKIGTLPTIPDLRFSELDAKCAFIQEGVAACKFSESFTLFRAPWPDMHLKAYEPKICCNLNEYTFCPSEGKFASIRMTGEHAIEELSDCQLSL